MQLNLLNISYTYEGAASPALERALAAFPGAIILVTHDEQLLHAVSTVRWHIDRTADKSCLRVV